MARLQGIQDLNFPTRIKPVTPHSGNEEPNHWTARELPKNPLIYVGAELVQEEVPCWKTIESQDKNQGMTMNWDK